MLERGREEGVACCPARASISWVVLARYSSRSLISFSAFSLNLKNSAFSSLTTSMGSLPLALPILGVGSSFGSELYLGLGERTFPPAPTPTPPPIALFCILPSSWEKSLSFDLSISDLFLGETMGRLGENLFGRCLSAARMRESWGLLRITDCFQWVLPYMRLPSIE